MHAAPLLLPENVEPSAHCWHPRSVVADPAADSPEPTAHVDHTTHAALPVPVLKLPVAQLVHTRSDDRPKAVVSYLPAAHTVMWLHVRSAVPLGASDVYCPCGQRALCVLHVRSEASVGLAVSYSSAVHTVTALHASPLLAVENVASCVHAAHWRLAVAEPALDWPWLAGHVRHGVHDICPALAVKCSAAHALHVRSAAAVATAVVYMPEAHGALTRSHASALFTLEYVLPTTQAAHWRSVEAEPSCRIPVPASQSWKVVQAPLPLAVLK